MAREKVSIIVVVVAAVLLWLVLRTTGVLPHRGPEVVLLGDSITFQTTEVFEERLGDDWGLTTSGVPGDRADQRLDDVADLAGRDPVQVVINLGTNDIMQRKPPAETEAVLEQLGSSFPHARCVHLVTVTASLVDLDNAGIVARAEELNARIRALAERRRWGVVPWDALVRDYDQSPQAGGPLTTDTIHPTDTGKRLLADAYHRALDAC